MMIVETSCHKLVHILRYIAWYSVYGVEGEVLRKWRIELFDAEGYPSVGPLQFAPDSLISTEDLLRTSAHIFGKMRVKMRRLADIEAHHDIVIEATDNLITIIIEDECTWAKGFAERIFKTSDFSNQNCFK